MTDNHEDSEFCKYDMLSVELHNGKKYWQLDNAERIELVDIWDERNK